ncbi:hypothetical protein NEIFLAOT_01248 [Neisseria flavescens NRL30031/H210]|uniref:Uncharacterized protein n=1 Tax=Neisseria flavescens NRL30031/H210 TaxID=546264 RepID=C0EMS2_NEIFL|nr:hypothetical protein NEIFLAOT_01248 [Neisseria flavescens NRL30031/H210]
MLEELDKQKIYSGGREKSLLEAVDLVYGVSGGSVLAAYFSLHGKETIPLFERRFLKQNFQRQVSKQVFFAGECAAPDIARVRPGRPVAGAV